MGELTRDTPKALLEYNGKPILQWDLEALPDEIDEVIIVIGHLGERIKEKFRNVFRKPLSFDSSPLSRGEEGEVRVLSIRYVKQKELKGTAHALWACKDLLKDRFLVFYGDDIYDKDDLEKLVKHPLAILVWEMETDESVQDRQALVKLNEKGELLDIIERRPAARGAFVNTGVYVLDTRVFNYPMKSAGTPANEYGLPQTFLQMAKDGAKFKVVKATKWHKIVGPEDLRM